MFKISINLEEPLRRQQFSPSALLSLFLPIRAHQAAAADFCWLRFCQLPLRLYLPVCRFLFALQPFSHFHPLHISPLNVCLPCVNEVVAHRRRRRRLNNFSAKIFLQLTK